jgi:histidinol-phosphate/aromatic aminotransferase/cobyric acid decarboxylase-like protein
MTVPKLPFSIPDIVKYPLQTVVYLLLAYFVFKEFTSKDECADVRAENAYLRTESIRDKADKSALTTALLVKNGIIIQQAQDKKELDSTIRTTVGTKAKKILKEE